VRLLATDFVASALGEAQAAPSDHDAQALAQQACNPK